ncbi:MAG: phosphatidylserine decarboxylase [Planctomycetes bacterium]|nr:phosphatidylserine decarboxylase [Planctomycetota bacterium]
MSSPTLPPSPAPQTTPFKRALSLGVGWLADRRLPRPLRAPLYRTYSRAYGVNLDEVRLELAEHPSFTAFFIRRLRDGARAFDPRPEVFPAPCDGTVQALDGIERGTILQAKGRPYAVRELLGGVGEDVELEGGQAWTVYLSPRDYHRVHCPLDARLVEVRTLPGARHSVAPKVLLSRPKVFSINERAVLRLESADGPWFLVMVGALNVGRIRVVGVEPEHQGPLAAPRNFARGDELARFEMGSTVVLVLPRSTPAWRAQLALGAPVRMGQSFAVREA